jgi:hypothetical protein
MAGGSRAPSQAPGVFHARLLFAGRVSAPRRCEPVTNRVAPAQEIDAPAKHWAAMPRCETQRPACGYVCPLRRFDPSPRHGKRNGAQPGNRDDKQARAGHGDHPHRLVANIEVRPESMPTPRPAARPVVLFVGRRDSNVFVAHWLMIENLSRHRCPRSSTAYECAGQAGESGTSWRLEGGNVVRPRGAFSFRVSGA